MRRIILALLVLITPVAMGGFAVVAVVAIQNPQAPTTTRVPPPAAPAASTAPLLTQADLVYVGAFRLPAGLNRTTSTFAYGAQTLAYNPARNSLIIGAHVNYQWVAEVTIPQIRKGAKVSDLDRAMLLQTYADPLAGKRGTYRLGGFLPLADRLIVSVYGYYDNRHLKPSHFRTGLDFKNPGTVAGPLQLGAIEGGFTGGYMAAIPPEWQAALGGPALTGQCCIPIIGRTSSGPSVSVFDPLAVGGGAPVPATMLLGYPLAHRTLGGCSGKLFNCSAHMGGVIFPGGTRSVLFFGRLGSTQCYGEGTKDPKLAGTLVGTSTTNRYCYDPTNGSKGNHGYPYKSFVWAYDAIDLAAVKAGMMQPWQVRPYATWEMHTPFENDHRLILGATMNPATRQIFLTVDKQDGSAPLVHTYEVRKGA